MRKIHTAESLIEVAHLRNVLVAAGIACQIRNDRLMGALGEIPFVDCWPELWLENERDALTAKGLIDGELRPLKPSPDWTCPSCGEIIEGQFSDCWHCSPPRD
ncbi:MAG: hypothetical protein RLZZ403_1718 [Pseudomonadota bacterium]|jgi:hypothetical protein